MVVWYRKPKARVSPADATYFDDLRASGRHPAADFGDLPDEAQSVIAAMEVQHLDLARERYFSSGALWFLLGVAALAFAHFGDVGRYVLVDPVGWDYVTGLVFVALSITRFVQGQRFELPDINERLREEWEIDYLLSRKRGTERRR